MNKPSKDFVAAIRLLQEATWDINYPMGMNNLPRATCTMCCAYHRTIVPPKQRIHMDHCPVGKLLKKHKDISE